MGGQAIPAEIVADEERRGFKTRGAYLERLRHFTRGLIPRGGDRLDGRPADPREFTSAQAPSSSEHRQILHPTRPANPRQPTEFSNIPPQNLLLDSPH